LLDRLTRRNRRKEEPAGRRAVEVPEERDPAATRDRSSSSHSCLSSLRIPTGRFVEATGAGRPVGGHSELSSPGSKWIVPILAAVPILPAPGSAWPVLPPVLAMRS
jgi:hypothetical protein